MNFRQHYLIATLAVIAVIAGVMVYMSRGREPEGCTDGVPYGLSKEGYDGVGNPSEDLDLVIADVDLVAQVTVLDDIVPAAVKVCKNFAYPSHTVRVRIDEVLYTDLAPSETPSVGDEIEVSTADTLSALSSNPDGRHGWTVSIIAINANRTNPATGASVPWLAYGRSRIGGASESIDQSWQDAIAAVADSGGSSG